MARTTRIGVMFRREQPPENLADYARRVEALGFDELWVVEDCFYTGGIAQAATALAATDRITVGLGIAPAVARNASFLAMEFATLARMHPGRFHGGIGHGVAEWMDQIGETPPSWLAALEETTTAVRTLMAGEEVSSSGKTVRLRDVQLTHPPTQVPPVSLGVRGPKSLQLAGRCADGTILAENSAPAYISWAREHIASGARDAGREYHHQVTVYANCVVSENEPDAARASIRQWTAMTLGGEGNVQLSPLPYADELLDMIAKHDLEALTAGLQDAWIDDLAITGTPEGAVAAIQRLADAGADAVVLVPPVDLDPDAWLGTIGTELLPRLMR
jgi:5,10-methylenetetrahydromethanopterin reductase